VTRAPGWARVVAALRQHPGATHGDLDEYTGLEGITQRISEARHHGYTIESRRVEDSVGRKIKRYYLTGEPFTGTLFGEKAS
jgi:hypothetical protein